MPFGIYNYFPILWVGSEVRVINPQGKERKCLEVLPNASDSDKIILNCPMVSFVTTMMRFKFHTGISPAATKIFKKRYWQCSVSKAFSSRRWETWPPSWITGLASRSGQEEEGSHSCLNYELGWPCLCSVSWIEEFHSAMEGPVGLLFLWKGVEGWVMGVFLCRKSQISQEVLWGILCEWGKPSRGSSKSPLKDKDLDWDWLRFLPRPVAGIIS
jgi:hypothetical protein